MRKIIYRISLICLLLIFSVNAYLYVKQPTMVFYPSSNVDVTPKDWGLSFDNVSLNLNDNTKINGWYLPHPQATKTILFFHGNGGNISNRGNSLYIFYKLKMNVLIIDYAGYGESEGNASEQSLYQSADAAWEYLIRDKKIKANDIIIFGRSLGGAVAVDLASRVKAGGLILESTFSSVRDIVGIIFSKWSNLIYLRYDFDSLSKIKRVASPVLVIHSAEDEVIPFELGQRLFENIQTEKQFLQINGGHNDGFMQSISSYMPTMAGFLHSLP